MNKYLSACVDNFNIDKLINKYDKKINIKNAYSCNEENVNFIYNNIYILLFIIGS